MSLSPSRGCGTEHVTLPMDKAKPLSGVWLLPCPVSPCLPFPSHIPNLQYLSHSLRFPSGPCHTPHLIDNVLLVNSYKPFKTRLRRLLLCEAMSSGSHPLSSPRLSRAWDRLPLRNHKIGCLFVYISDFPMSQRQDCHHPSQCPAHRRCSGCVC